MITASDTQDFVPFGREYVQQHPGKFQIQVQNVVHTDPGLHFLKSFRDISLQDNGKKEQWTLYHEKDAGDGRGSYDEELYVNGNTVIWSRGGQDGCRSVVKTFTMDTPVLQALWCNFVIPESSNPDEICSTLDTKGDVLSGVCVVESNCASCFINNGSDYLAALPFQVAHTWVIKNGLLFERMVSPMEFNSQKSDAPNQTTVFSLLHPLDEVAPVITKTGTAGSQKISYLTDNTQHVVFSSVDLSIVLTYDTMVGVHSAWKVRRARQEECSSVSNTWDQTNSIYQMGPSTPAHNYNQSSSNLSRYLGNMSTVQSPQVSPLRYSGHISSPAFLSHSQSPLTGNIGIDRCSQSPAVFGNNSFHRLNTPSPQTSKSPGNFYRTPPNMSLINESFTETIQPIRPEICLEHIWTEMAPAIRDGSLGKSSKAFLTRDVCGQQYLCYVISYRQQLRCVKFEESNDLKKLVFGTVNVIPCKDAVPIESKDILIVLDTNGCLYVYSGITKLNRLYVPALPLGNMSLIRQMTPLQSPVRGGVFTSSRPPSAMDAKFEEEFQLNQISPVPTELEESGNFDEFPLACGFIQCLRDNIADRFTIELTNGHLFRCTVPDVTNSPGIDLCLKALKHMLPRDVALQMIGRWYTERNSLGGIGTHREWLIFIRSLLSMMGYDTSRLPLTYRHDMDTSLSPVSAKRAKTSDQGSDEDWEMMLTTDHHKLYTESLEDILGLSVCKPTSDSKKPSQQATVNIGAMLFNHIPACFMALHYVYEELKLNTLLIEDLEQIVTILHQLAIDLQCLEFVDYYRRDFPKLHKNKQSVSQVKEEYLDKMNYPSIFTKLPPSLFDWIIKSLEGQKTGAFMYIPFVCNNIQNIVSLYALLLNKHMSTDLAIEKCLRKIPPSGHRAPTCDISMSRSFCTASPTHNYLERTVLYMTQLGMTEKDLTYLPVGVVLPIREAMFQCRCNPPSDWPGEAYSLIGREDISRLLSLQDKEDVSPPPGIFKRKPNPQSQGSKEEDDGMEHLDDEYLRLRFSEDLRVQEARRLLQSSRPARIALVQKPEISDHDFIEEQERHLYSICIRTMALSVGRGMFTLSTYHPLPTETLPIPKLCLTGKAPPRNTTVDLSHIDTVPNMTAWPLFHNGVAAGLRIVDFSQVDSSWIMYNRPKSNELTNEFAGFLMALGLNKHLVKMHILNKHDYLSKEHEMTTIGLLLGVAAAMRSTMDLTTLKMLSVHLPAMLPPTSTELNVSHNVQVAAILGVGLVFQGTGHRHTADIMLAEIGRPPGPELQNCKDRESYSLAAGLSLGLVMFGKGKETMGSSDLSMALYHYMVGGQKRPLVGPSQERFKTPSYQIQEGDTVNVDVTSPGATLALGMLYFNTKNSAVSEWLKVPDTQVMLDQVRPDFLLLRTLARGLVMWDCVLPTNDFIKQTLPKLLTDFAFQKYQTPGDDDDDDDNDVDYETLSQAYCHVVAGACMVVGLKFAGSASDQAFETLMRCMNVALKVVGQPTWVEQAGKSTVENCVCTILLSIGMVMAGTGNLEVLRLCRMLRARVGPPYNQYVMYGSHMAISMTVGLLFLGGGKYTLSTKDEAIAVMLCAFFPKFPTHSNNNRYHLQAFRHLYVLAAELRTMLPRDVDTGFPCYVPIEIRFKDTKHYSNEWYKTTAPCTLPELDRLQQIKILGPRYWPIVFDRDKNWDSLRALLRHNGTLYVKQRAGHLSYVEDPKGYRSMLAKSFTVDQSSQTCIKPDVIKAFTSDAKVVALTEHFFSNQDDSGDLLQILSDVLYECVTLEKPEAISTHIQLDQITRRSEFQLCSLGVSQLKLINAYYNLEHCSVLSGANDMYDDITHNDTQCQGRQLLKPEFVLSMSNRLKHVFDKWLQVSDNVNVLIRYLKGDSIEGCKQLSTILTWYDIPSPSQLAHISINGTPSLPALCSVFPQLHVSTLMMLLNAWKTKS